MTGKNVVLITGCSSGVGYSTSLYLARRGFRVYSTMRKLSKAGPILEAKKRENLPIDVLRLDVTDKKSVTEAVSKIVRNDGKIDVLVNNAGAGMEGPVDSTPMEDLYSLFETNFFGLVRMTKEVVPHMIKKGGGRIVNVSSAAGKISIPFNSAYCASKFAVEGFSESIYYELRPHGIRVVLVEPGVIKTRFFKNMKAAKQGGDPYYAAYARKTQWEQMGGVAPEKVSAVIHKAITSKRPKIRYAVGRDAWGGIFLKRLLPERLFLWGVGRRYVK